MNNINPVWITVVLVTAWPLISLAQQTPAHRSPSQPYWSDYANAVNGRFSTPQQVCDARADLINWNGHLTYTQTQSYKGQCVSSGGSVLGYAYFGQHCPAYYSMKDWVEQFAWFVENGIEYGIYYGPHQYCEAYVPYIDRWHDKPQQSCQPSAGNPVFPLTGNKRQTENILNWSSYSLPLHFVYDNRRKLPDADPEGAFTLMPTVSVGGVWESNLHKRLIFQTVSNGNGYYYHIQASRGSSVWTSFTSKRTSFWRDPLSADSDIKDRLLFSEGGWLYVDAQAQAQEKYDGSGVLIATSYARGGNLAYFYSDSSAPLAVAPVAGLLVKVQDQFGRALRLEYEQPASAGPPHIVRVIDPDGQTIHVEYDATGNLNKLAWPDGRVRKFLYEQNALSWALTGIVDENDERHSTYTYDAEGRALSTEYSVGMNRYSLSYGSAPRWVTTETFDSTSGVFWRDHNWQAPGDAVLTTPNGAAVSFGATLINGMPRMTTRSQPAGAGCDASSSSLSYDANGNVTSKTDFNGTRSCHAYDLSRNLETARIDGLSATDVCPADSGAFNIAAEASQRKTTTQWHPAWSLPIKRAEPKKITISVYNGQPDPTAGNATASCAPTTALLPDGSPIAVMCKKVEQATTDANGSLGFNAAVTGTPRTWTYAYNQYGQVLTGRDPLNKLTTYVYYSDTTDQHTMGDLQSIADSVGRVTQYTRYDKSGRLMQSVGANGTVTDTTYTPRGWVKTVTVTPVGGAAQLAVYDYDGVGQLKKATLPDATVLEYTYDAAHRLTSVKDTAGNSVTYTLDNMGNRTGEDLKDPSGTLARNITRVYDALNRVQGSMGAAQ